jgi:hypothetical protein
MSAGDSELELVGRVDPAYDSWPLLYADSFSWRPHPFVFALTATHADRGVFERYEPGGPGMRSHP